MAADDPLTIIGLAALELRYLIASRRAELPQVTDGVTSGAGNQGSAAFLLIGHSGTGAAQLQIPRNLRFGNTAAATP
jgi:hypothetical protein